MQLSRQERRALERQEAKKAKLKDKLAVAEEVASLSYSIFKNILREAMPKVKIPYNKQLALLAEVEARACGDKSNANLVEDLQLRIHNTPHKPTRRLSNAERTDFLMVNLAFIALHSLADRFTKKGIFTKEEKTALKTSYTWLLKALTGATSRFAPDEERKQREFASRHKVAFLEETEIRDGKMIRELMEEEKRVVMTRDQFCDFADHVIPVVCVECQKAYKKCELYRIMWEMDIDPIDPYGDGCPYRYHKTLVSGK